MSMCHLVYDKFDNHIALYTKSNAKDYLQKKFFLLVYGLFFFDLIIFYFDLAGKFTI